MFSAFVQKLGEAEQSLVLAASSLATAPTATPAAATPTTQGRPETPTPALPAASSAASPPAAPASRSSSPDVAAQKSSVDQLQRQIDRYREKLANGMHEFKKISEENQKMETEIKTLRAAAQRPPTRPGESPEEIAALRSKNQALEKELGQLRFNAKLKIKQLQKELQTARGDTDAANSDIVSTTTSSFVEPEMSEERKRMTELENKLDAATKERDAAVQRAKSLEAELEQMHEKNYREIEALEKRHTAELDAFQLRLSSSNNNIHAFIADGSQAIANCVSTPANLVTDPTVDLAALVRDLATQVRSYDAEAVQENTTDPEQISRELADHFAMQLPKNTNLASDNNVSLKDAKRPLQNQSTSSHDAPSGSAHAGIEHQDLLKRIALLERQLLESQSQNAAVTTERGTDPDKHETVLSEETKSQLNKLKQERDEKRSLNEQLSQQLDEARNNASTTPAVLVPQSDAPVVSTTLRSQLESRARELEMARSQASTLMEEKLSLENKLAEIQAQVSALEQSNRNFEAAAKAAPDLSAIEQRNFTLEEQLKDFRIQVASRHRELTTLQERLTAKTAECEKMQKEHEERIRKMKGLLHAANKNITETKSLIKQREFETEDLRARLEASVASEHDLRARVDHLQKTLERASMESQDDRDARRIQLEELQKQLSAAQAESQHVRTEFQSYKVRAAAALQKTGTSALEMRVVDLEGTNRRLERDRNENLDRLEQTQERVKLLEADVSAALEQIAMAETTSKQLERSEIEIQSLQTEIESLTRKLEFEKQLHEQSIQSKELSAASAIQQLKAHHAKAIQDLETNARREQSEELKRRTSHEALVSEIESLKEQLVRTQADLERHRKAATDVGRRGSVSSSVTGDPDAVLQPQPSPTDNESMSGSSARRRASVSSNYHRGSMTHPQLSRTGSATAIPYGQSTHTTSHHYPSIKEKEYQIQITQLQETLTETQSELERLHNQQHFLKEELRRIDRIDKRQDINIEYLKNVMMSFVESDVREPLIPILAEVLHLSPNEVQRIRSKIKPTEDVLMSGFGFFG